MFFHVVFHRKLVEELVVFISLCKENPRGKQVLPAEVSSAPRPHRHGHSSRLAVDTPDLCETRLPGPSSTATSGEGTGAFGCRHSPALSWPAAPQAGLLAGPTHLWSPRA